MSATHIKDWNSLDPKGPFDKLKKAHLAIQEIKTCVENDVPNLLVTVTANYTVTAKDSVIFCNSATAITVMLPSASLILGKVYIIKNINVGVVLVQSFDAAGIENVTLSYSFPKLAVPGACIWIVSKPYGWQILHQQMLSYVNVTNAYQDPLLETTPTQIKYHPVNADYNNEFTDAADSTSKITAKFSGPYLFIFSINLTKTTELSNYVLYVEKNGAVQNPYTFGPTFALNASVYQAQVSVVIPVIAGDTIKFFVQKTDYTQSGIISGGTLMAAKL